MMSRPAPPPLRDPAPPASSSALAPFQRMLEGANATQALEEAGFADAAQSASRLQDFLASPGVAHLSDSARARLERVHALTEPFFAHGAAAPEALPDIGEIFNDPEAAGALMQDWSRRPALRTERARTIFRRIEPELLRRLAHAADPDAALSENAWKKHQMPAYHLTAPGGKGITVVNIGVGPSNAKTITDHLAVTRPHVWLMIGHCGGLRSTQKIGDFVLAHAYLRDDHVLDPVLPPEVPIPPIAEVQQAMAEAAEQVAGVQGANLKQRMRTGTVVTTDDRNWELRWAQERPLINLARAVAQSYYESRERLGFPMAPREWVAQMEKKAA